MRVGAAGVGAGAGAGAGVGIEGCTKKDREGESRERKEEESHVSPGRFQSQKPLSKASRPTQRRLQQEGQQMIRGVSIVP